MIEQWIFPNEMKKEKRREVAPASRDGKNVTRVLVVNRFALDDLAKFGAVAASIWTAGQGVRCLIGTYKISRQVDLGPGLYRTHRWMLKRMRNNPETLSQGTAGFWTWKHPQCVLTRRGNGARLVWAVVSERDWQKCGSLSSRFGKTTLLSRPNATGNRTG
jgi:hypothetical protein